MEVEMSQWMNVRIVLGLAAVGSQLTHASSMEIGVQRERALRIQAETGVAVRVDPREGETAKNVLNFLQKDEIKTALKNRDLVSVSFSPDRKDAYYRNAANEPALSLALLAEEEELVDELRNFDKEVSSEILTEHALNKAAAEFELESGVEYTRNPLIPSALQTKFLQKLQSTAEQKRFNFRKDCNRLFPLSGTNSNLARQSGGISEDGVAFFTLQDESDLQKDVDWLFNAD
jgi:hypothetical protein